MFEPNATTSSPDGIFVVVTIWSAIGVFGLTTNLLIIAGILRSRKLAQSTSYWLIVALSLCDSGMVLTSFVVILPATTLQSAYLPTNSLGNSASMFVYDTFWYSGVLLLLLMALNRYVKICRAKSYTALFSPHRTVVLMAAAYLAGLVVAVPGLFPCCRLVYNYAFNAVQYEPADTSYRHVDITINGLTITAMIFCYSAIILKVRRSRLILLRYRMMLGLKGRSRRSWHHRSSNAARQARLLCLPIPNQAISRREIRLFVQFCTVSTVFLVTWVTWQWLPYAFSSRWAGMACTTLFFINNCTNPTVYLLFNSVLREQVGEIVCFCTRREMSDRLVLADHTDFTTDRRYSVSAATLLSTNGRRRITDVSANEASETAVDDVEDNLLVRHLAAKAFGFTCEIIRPDDNDELEEREEQEPEVSRAVFIFL